MSILFSIKLIELILVRILSKIKVALLEYN
jgi:hypothetical protein